MALSSGASAGTAQPSSSLVGIEVRATHIGTVAPNWRRGDRTDAIATRQLVRARTRSSTVDIGGTAECIGPAGSVESTRCDYGGRAASIGRKTGRWAMR
jgi:hypothetical protein